jgi:hypothetical protein
MIKAPAPGLVVYASSSEIFMRRGGGGSNRTIAEGETVYERQKIITLPDTAEMIAEIAVHEAEVDKVRSGQRAAITLDPFPDQEFKGQVLKVAQLLDAHLVQQLKDVIIVPVQVVANRGGKKVCFVLTSAGTQEQRVIQTGAFDDTFVEIVEGLEEGEEVLLNPKRVTEGGSGYESRQETDRFESDEPGSGPGEPPAPQRGRPRQGMGAGPGDREPGRSRGQGGRGAPGSEGRQRREGAPGGGGAMGGPRASQGGGGPGGRGGPGGGQRELTEERIDMIMGMMAQRNPDKAKELEPLRKSDPEKFKAELMKAMQSMFSGMRRGGNQGGPGSNAGPGRGQNQ